MEKSQKITNGTLCLLNDDKKEICISISDLAFQSKPPDKVGTFVVFDKENDFTMRRWHLNKKHEVKEDYTILYPMSTYSNGEKRDELPPAAIFLKKIRINMEKSNNLFSQKNTSSFFKKRALTFGTDGKLWILPMHYLCSQKSI